MHTMITGFPGFLGRRLTERLLQDHPRMKITLLVQARMMQRAKQTVDEFAHKDRVKLVSGDITEPQLGLSEASFADLHRKVTHFWHLAAVYDLSIDAETARRINVEGTARVLGFLKECTKLKTFYYISTAYVSGLRQGRIQEEELVHTRGFKNEYEKSKYEAELLVQSEQKQIPTIIFRPGIVVGDSQTGATDKFDGPYSIFRIMKKLPPFLPMIRIGSGENKINMVPVDYVIDAMTGIAKKAKPDGSAYHITDPSPLTVNQLFDVLSHTMNKRFFVFELSPEFAKILLKFGGSRILGIQNALMDYFHFPVEYDSIRAQKILRRTEVECPLFEQYCKTLIEYMGQNYDSVRKKAMY